MYTGLCHCHIRTAVVIHFPFLCITQTRFSVCQRQFFFHTSTEKWPLDSEDNGNTKQRKTTKQPKICLQLHNIKFIVIGDVKAPYPLCVVCWGKVSNRGCKSRSVLSERSRTRCCRRRAITLYTESKIQIHNIVGEKKRSCMGRRVTQRFKQSSFWQNNARVQKYKRIPMQYVSENMHRVAGKKTTE